MRINKYDLELVLNGLALEKFDARGVGSVRLISLDEEDGD